MLSQPVTSKMLERSGNKLYRVGRTDMQGYRLNMEDAMTVILGLGKGREDWAFFGVFDGHAGAKASAFLGQHLHEHVCALEDPFDDAQLQECVNSFDALFCSDESRRMDGSTCVFAVVRPTNKEKTEFEIVVSNTGDSRVILIRKKDHEMVSMTEDHKPNTPAERNRIVAAGGSVSMNRTDGQLAMSRAIGDYQYKCNPELTQALQKVIPTPDITHETLEVGDTIVVMCDGIVEQMTNEQTAQHVVASMEEHNDPAQAVAELFTHSLEAGSKDNHSAILIVLEDGSDYGPPHKFEAGPYHPYKNDSQFADCYVKDAARYGIEGEELFAAARVTEEKLGPFETIPAESAVDSSSQYMRLLQHIQMNYNMANGLQFRAPGAEEEGGATNDNEDEDDDVGGDIS